MEGAAGVDGGVEDKASVSVASAVAETARDDGDCLFVRHVPLDVRSVLLEELDVTVEAFPNATDLPGRVQNAAVGGKGGGHGVATEAAVSMTIERSSRAFIADELRVAESETRVAVRQASRGRVAARESYGRGDVAERRASAVDGYTRGRVGGDRGGRRNGEPDIDGPSA